MSQAGSAQAAPDTLPVRRCINLGHGLEAPFEGAWGRGIAAADLTAVAAAGFDTVRLPVRFSAGYTGGRINPALLDRVAQVIDQATARGLNVILDLHHFDELMDAPERHADMFVAIWAEIGARFEGAPPGVMFELLNEPSGALDTAGAQALYDRVIPMLRRTHPDRWLIVSGGDWSAAATLAELAPPGHRVAATFHYYDPFDFTHQLADWVDPVRPRRGPATPDELDVARAEIAAAAAKTKALGAPVLLGEFGVHDTVPEAERAPWIAAVRAAAEAAGMPWCHWGLHGNFAARDPDTGRWLPAIRDALLE